MARLVFLTLPAGKRDRVVEILEDEGVDFSVSDDTSGQTYDTMVQFPLPTNAVEPILDRIREAGIDDDAITVTVETQTVNSRSFDELEDRFADDPDSPEQIARDELLSAAENLVPASLHVYAGMTVVSSIIATAGLLLDSAAVVVGSMVIAPLIGPAMATSVGTVFRERELFRDGIRLQIVGLLVAVASGALFAIVVKTGHLVPPGLDILSIPQVRQRFRPDVLSLVVALGSGIAGVVSLATGLSSALVGVMIAVALIPPAATIGIGIAWMQPGLVLGSSVLLLVNVLSINFAALVLLWYMGYTPNQWFKLQQARSVVLKRAGVLIVSILILSAFLGTVTFASYQTATTEESIRGDVEGILSEEAYQDIKLLNIQFEYAEDLLSRSPSSVTILLGAPGGEVPPDLGERLDIRIDRAAGQDVHVQIRYVIIQQPG